MNVLKVATQFIEKMSDRDSQVTLLDLPIEVFLHICSFLESSTIVHNLSLVCKQFHQILRDKSLWKVRINRVWPNANFPVLRPAKSDKRFWKLACVEIEKQAALWRHQEDTMRNISLGNVQYSTIDALLLMHNGTTCISGARDRSLVHWGLSKDKKSYNKLSYIKLAHNGWIWDMTEMDNIVYSCSWDQSVKSWALTNVGLFPQRTYEMVIPGALLCVTSSPEQLLFATGSYSRTVFIFDSRLGSKPTIHYRPHTRAVIKLAMNSRYILSASEDKTVSVWDQRATRTLKSITISEDAFPMCISMQRDCVYIGDSAAKLHVLDPKKEFELVKSYTTEHTKGITGVHHTYGCLITSSTDGTVRIASPTDPPIPMVTLTSPFGEIASMDYQNGVLAICGTERIKIWRPKCMRVNKAN